jgi:hypothetical protein
MSRLTRQTNLALETNISKRNYIRNRAETSQIGLVIGHGTQVDAVPFTVPDNVHVVFLSDPGYALAVNIVNTPFERMVGNLRKFRNFIRGTLPANDIPLQLRRRNWKWWDHIFQPRSACPNLSIEFFDRSTPWIDNICGLWYAGPTGTPVLGVSGSNASGRKLYNRTMNLREISEVADRNTRNHGGCILFINSCRIPLEQIPLYTQNIWYPEARMGLGTAYARSAGMQNFPLPASRVVNVTRALESNASRLATRKRKMTGPASRNIRPRRSSNSNSNNTSNNIQLSRTQLSNFRNMLNRISASNMNVSQAREQFPNFFRGMNNVTATNIIRNLKGNNRNNIKNHVINMSRMPLNDIQNYRVNSGPTAQRIIARMRNMGVLR